MFQITYKQRNVYCGLLCCITNECLRDTASFFFQDLLFGSFSPFLFSLSFFFSLLSPGISELGGCFYTQLNLNSPKTEPTGQQADNGIARLPSAGITGPCRACVIEEMGFLNFKVTTIVKNHQTQTESSPSLASTNFCFYTQSGSRRGQENQVRWGWWGSFRTFVYFVEQGDKLITAQRSGNPATSIDSDCCSGLTAPPNPPSMPALLLHRSSQNPRSVHPSQPIRWFSFAKRPHWGLNRPAVFSGQTDFQVVISYNYYY